LHGKYAANLELALGVLGRFNHQFAVLEQALAVSASPTFDLSQSLVRWLA
jgi:hypothetical protein